MKRATWLSILGLLGGVWIMLAPAIVGYAPKHGNPWPGVVLGPDVLGALVIVAAIVGLAGFWGHFLKELTDGESEPLIDP